MDMVNLPRRNRMRSNSVDLPGDILTDIFLRLPFDSLLYCKLVSIEWKNLINHPTFSMKYKGYTNSMFLFSDFYRILCLRIRHDKNKQLTKAGNPRFTVHQVPTVLDENNYVPYFINYTNGIACVLKNRVYYFYNLVTGSPALHSVNDSPLTNPRSYQWKYYGFGYDAYGDDYKIVQFCHYTVGKDIDTTYYAPYADDTQYWVYSFKNQEWKSFIDFPYSAYAAHPSDVSPYSGATTVNGVLHWLVPREGKGVIITYDLHTGVFGEIVLPVVGGNEAGNGFYRSNFGLQELNGKLCYTYKRVYTYHNRQFFDVWRMVGDSWVMLVSIDCRRADGNISWNMCDNRVRPRMLYECSDGRRLILFMDKCGAIPALHWYDFINNKCETFPSNVWHQQRIQNRTRAIVKRKTSHVVKS